MVSGTSPHPSVSERWYAASSRLKRPGGKSHSGRSPRSGLYTASARASPRLTSARKVALLERGSRPFSVISPRTSSARTSVDDVTIAPRAHVAVRILWLAAHRTDRAATLHEGLRAADEGGRLLACDAELRGRRLVALLLHRRRGHDHDAPRRVLVAEADGGDGPRRLDRLEQRGLRQLHTGAGRQLVEQLGQVFPERAHLLLLALQRDQAPPLPRLDVEDTVARRTDGAAREVLGRPQLE